MLCAKDVHQGPPDIVDFRFVGFSPNGKVAATIAKTTLHTNSGTKEKQYLTLWDTGTGQKLQQIDDVGTGKVVFLRDCRTFVTGGAVSSADQPQHVDFWDVETGQRKKQITDNGMSGFFLSADGRFLVTTYRILTNFTPMPDGQGSAIDRRFGGELGTPLRVWETGYNLAEQPTSPSSEQTATNAEGSAPPAVSNPNASPLPKSENKEVAAKEAPSQTATAPVPPQEPSQKKSPVPDAGALAEATKLIKDIYGDDWKAAKTTAQKQALAKKLFQKAKETEPKDAARFVLLRLSRDIAAQALDGQTAFQAIDEMDQSFQIDALEMKLAVLTTGASAEQTAEQHDTIAKMAADLSEKAVASENFPLAKQLNELALAEARKGRDPRLTSRASHRRAEIDELAKAYDAVQAAAAVLDKTPTDPDANLTLGKYKCFSKADWEKGLPMLALGSDEQLKTLAKKELGGAASSAEQTKLGDGWWDLAETQEGTAKTQMQGRARYWYAKALPGATGLVKDKLEKRLGTTGSIAGGERREETKPVGSNPQPASETGHVQTLDLLKLMVPTRHTAWGTWDKSGHRLTTQEWSGITIPASVQGDYDLHVEFVRLSGSNEISLLFPVNGKRCQLFLGFSIRNESPVSGLSTTENVDPRFNKTKIPGMLANGQKYKITLSVKTHGQELAEINVTRDGQPYLTWKGNPAELTCSPYWKWSNDSSFGFGARSPVALSGATLTQVGRLSCLNVVALSSHQSQPKICLVNMRRKPSTFWHRQMSHKAQEVVTGRWHRDTWLDQRRMEQLLSH